MDSTALRIQELIQGTVKCFLQPKETPRIICTVAGLKMNKKVFQVRAGPQLEF